MAEDQKLIVYRDLILDLVPRWLRKGSVGPGILGKVLYAIGAQLDAVSDALVFGVKRRFPGYNGQYDSLPLLGKERRIARGPLETDAGYAARLLPWLTDHSTRGNPYAMLRQLHGFWQGSFLIALVNSTGASYTMALDGTIFRSNIPGWAPYIDPVSGQTRALWKLFYYWTPTLTDDGLWGSPGSSGDMHWGDGGIWGCSLTPTEVQNILLVPTEWNAAHTDGSVTLLPPAIWVDTSLWQSPGLVSIAVY